MLPAPLVEGTTYIISSGLLFKKVSLSENGCLPLVVFLARSMACFMPEKFWHPVPHISNPPPQWSVGVGEEKVDTFMPPLNILISAEYFSPQLWEMLKYACHLHYDTFSCHFFLCHLWKFLVPQSNKFPLLLDCDSFVVCFPLKKKKSS